MVAKRRQKRYKSGGDESQLNTGPSTSDAAQKKSRSEGDETETPIFPKPPLPPSKRRASTEIELVGGGEHIIQCNEVALDKSSLTMENIFDRVAPMKLRKEVIIRGILLSFFMSTMLIFVIVNISITTGTVHPINTYVGIVTFLFMDIWMIGLTRMGVRNIAFTREEHTLIHIAVVTASTVAFNAGFGNYLLGMRPEIAKQFGGANTEQDINDPNMSWIIPFLFVANLSGSCLLIPLFKIMIVDLNLSYPSGTATGHLINNLHIPDGVTQTKKQVRVLKIFLLCSFLWGFLRWSFTRGVGCGLVLPIFGQEAYEHQFYLELSAAYIGIGMMCPHMINVSQLIGGILSTAILWPLIEAKKGDWYSSELKASSMYGLQGYKVSYLV
ncbi:probable metal-nicotianamine transporter YSL7 [Cajanus cajan]|uniref:probable metal-nicotianamine transporter YSL7 n=1 Tax=Cajanus cajan TaxID=3821 RepID=UPI00098DB277|nr:probable metal-nicotianamine transporter YSL7 [Cajanus cajan]